MSIKIITIIAFATAASSFKTEFKTHLRKNNNKVMSDESTDEYAKNNLLHGRGLMQIQNHRALSDGIPNAKNIDVQCYNETSNCGFNGQCRVAGEVSFCKCDDGYYSMELDKPCEAKGKSQSLMAAMWYLFGWTGGSAFALGWISLGVWTLMTFCCGCCCLAKSKDEKQSDIKRAAMTVFGFMNYVALFGLWIYVAVKISTSSCVDSDGVPCKKW